MENPSLPQWLYLPPIESADIVKTIDDGKLCIELYTNLKSSGAISYRYMIGVYPSGTKLPLLLIASETSEFLPLEGRGNFALGVFRANGHRTLDVSDGYGDWSYFVNKARELIEAEFYSDAEDMAH